MKKETILTTAGRQPKKHSGAVNPPIYKTSTILFPTLEAYHEAERGKTCYENSSGSVDVSYGLAGTPTTFALQEALAEAEGGTHCLITQSGLSAITASLLAFLKSGDHLLMTDTVYGPTRRFCNKMLKGLGIETTYYDPLIGAGIAELIRDNTRVIFLESPGSLTFEVQDIPAITAVAKERGITTIADNSWSTPLYFRPLEHGVDVSVQAITKYIGGHSDLVMGAVISGEKAAKPLGNTFRYMGIGSSPEDCYMALRGLRSLAARMERHQASAYKVVEWLEGRGEVSKILWPVHQDCPGHTLWKRDFTGAASLFTLVLDKQYSFEALCRMINGMKIFGIGCSWGGYESLILNIEPASVRSAVKWKEKNTCLRLFIGLEDADDLIRELEKGFERLKK